jgi:outer membrane lipoprotein-sorting protein
MAGHFGRIEELVVVAFILGVALAAPLAEGQDAAGRTGREMALSSDRAPVGLSGDDVIAQMLQRNLLRKQQLQHYSAIRTYEIRNLEGKVAAQAVVRVEYRAPDQKTFSKTSEKGSSIVRHLVFDRLIQSESETSSGREHHNSEIATANYTFTLAGEEKVGPYHSFVLEAIPKRKDKYLFEGKIWIDAEDFAIVKIAGHPAKRPSFWINRADFIRQYQRIDGFWLPCRDETYVDVKMYGHRVFTVDHQQYVIDPVNHLQADKGDTGDLD